MKKIVSAVLVATASLGLAACDVDQTEEGELPEIEGGNLPEYDVEPVDVDVDSNIEMPTVDVDVDQPDAEGEPVTGDEE